MLECDKCKDNHPVWNSSTATNSTISYPVYFNDSNGVHNYTSTFTTNTATNTLTWNCNCDCHGSS